MIYSGEVIAGSSAYQADLNSQDSIIAVDEINSLQMRKGEMQLRIKGLVGSKVELTILRNDSSTPFDIEVTRVSANQLLK